jgi:divalent metal cation (Fe/Co/Zn/Cd) transporter
MVIDRNLQRHRDRAPASSGRLAARAAARHPARATHPSGGHRVIRTILAVLAGLLVALGLLLGLEYLAMSLFPPPPGTTLADEADLARLVADAPAGKLLWVTLAWAAAALGGGWTAARVARRHRTAAAMCVGALVAAGVAMTVLEIPHPAWMTAAGLLLPLPLAWLGGRLAAPRLRTP